MTVLSESVKDLKKLRGFRTHRWNSSNNLANSTTKTFWEVKTQFKKFKFIHYLKLKTLYGEITDDELRLLIDSPGFFQDDLFISALRAKQTGISSKVLDDRLLMIRNIFGTSLYQENLLWTLNGTVKFRIREIRLPIRPAEKYTGYVRNSSAVGSKNSSKLFIPEPETVEWNINEEIDYYNFLTVGEFDSGPFREIKFTLMRTKSSKR